MADATPSVSPLRRRMIDDMTLRNLSPATQRSYLHAVAKFSRYCDRSPDRLGLEDVRAFQVYLVSQGISWPALNQTVCALRFFYGVTLNRAEIPERIGAIWEFGLWRRLGVTGARADTRTEGAGGSADGAGIGPQGARRRFDLAVDWCVDRSWPPHRVFWSTGKPPGSRGGRSRGA